MFRQERSRKFAGVENVARRKLRLLHDAEILGDLAAVPGNRLELLKGDRRGQYSLRINESGACVSIGGCRLKAGKLGLRVKVA